MANTTKSTSKSTSKSGNTKSASTKTTEKVAKTTPKSLEKVAKTTPKSVEKVAEPVENSVEQNKNDVVTEVASSTHVSDKVWEPDLSARIPVRSAVYGTLIYKDSLTNRVYEWGEYGQTQRLTLEMLENARNTQPAFFTNGWWEIDDENVLEWLDAKKFYTANVSISNFDSLLNKSAEEIVAVVNKLGVSQKVQLARRAQELIQEGKLDSMRAIRALEKALNVDFEM